MIMLTSGGRALIAAMEAEREPGPMTRFAYVDTLIHAGRYEDARAALAAKTAGEVHAIAATRLRAAGLTEHPDIGEWLEQLLDAALSPT